MNLVSLLMGRRLRNKLLTGTHHELAVLERLA